MRIDPANKHFLDRICQAIHEEANKRREAAGHGGEYSDRGASVLEGQLAAFEMGLNFRSDGELPKEWDDIVRQVYKEVEPEYKKYLELKKKFEG